MKLINDLFLEFDEKFSDTLFNNDWYNSELGVHANLKKSVGSKDKNGDYSEEYYRARMVYGMVNSGMYPNDKIYVEFQIPKGNKGKKIEPDIVVFSNDDWEKDLLNAKRNGDYSNLRKDYLVFFEAKKNNNTVQKAIENQLRSEMTESTSSGPIYGIYFDNLENILAFKKTGKTEIYRYYSKKRILKGATGIRSLNLSKRDPLNELPSYNDLMSGIEAYSDLSNQYVEHMEPIDQKAFGEIVHELIKAADKIHPNANVKDLIVEFLTLKIFDEKRSLETKKPVKFYISPKEENGNGTANDSFRNRINELYDKAKIEYKNLLSTSRQSFNYDDHLRPDNLEDEKFLINVVNQLQRYSILNAPNDAFNQIIFNNFGQDADKATKSQFFTPIPIVNTIVEMVNPTLYETVADPAAGIADFLAMTYKHTRASNTSKPASNLYAFDIDKENLKLAELNLVLNGDGGAQIHQMDSLAQKLSKSNVVSTDGDFTEENVCPKTWNSKKSQDLDPLKYDVILTNPPFGQGRNLLTGQKDKWDLPSETMNLYETYLNKSEKLPPTMDMGALFLENSVKLLKKGGRMAIILSNSIATIDEWKNVRKWLLENVRLVATIDLPAKSFGETGVATTVFIAYKPKDSEKYLLTSDYSVYMANVEELGYEVKTINRVITFKPKFKHDSKTFEKLDEIDEDFTEIISKFKSFLLKQERPIKDSFLKDE